MPHPNRYPHRVMRRPRAFVCMILGGLFVFLATQQAVRAQDVRTPQTDAPAPPSEEESATDGARLKTLASEYLSALHQAVTLEVHTTELELHASLYPSAWELEAVQQLLTGLAEDKSVAEMTRTLREDKKLAKRLKAKAAIRWRLRHPKAKKKPKRGEAKDVHIWFAKLVDAVVVQHNKKRVKWQVWRKPAGVEVAKVKIARHATVRQGTIGRVYVAAQAGAAARRFLAPRMPVLGVDSGSFAGTQIRQALDHPELRLLPRQLRPPTHRRPEPGESPIRARADCDCGAFNASVFSHSSLQS